MIQPGRGEIPGLLYREEIMETLLKLGIVIFVWLGLDFLIMLVIRK